MAAILTDAQALTTFTLESESIRLCEREKHYAEAQIATMVVTPAETGYDEQCYPLTNVQLRLLTDSEHAGWLGFYPTARAEFHLDVASTWPSSLSAIASPDVEDGSTRADDVPDWPFYLQRVTQPHFLVNATGQVRYEGAGAIKLKGPDVIVRATENTTTHRTEDSPSNDAAVRERVMRWLTIEFENATIVLTTPTPLHVAAQSLRGDWNGRVSFIPVDGVATSSSATYSASRKAEWVEGEFHGNLMPIRDDRAQLALEGQLAATSLVSVPLEQPGARGGFPSWLGLALFGLAASAVVVAGGTLLAQERAHGVLAWRKPTPDRTGMLDGRAYFEHYALVANERLWFAVALEWIQAAREHGPDDAELALWEATMRLQLGQLDAALTHYHAASALAPESGEADYWAAVLLVQRGQGGDTDRALEHLECSLRREPERAAIIERDPVFGPLHGPDFNAMLDEAYERASRAGPD